MSPRAWIRTPRPGWRPRHLRCRPRLLPRLATGYRASSPSLWASAGRPPAGRRPRPPGQATRRVTLLLRTGPGRRLTCMVRRQRRATGRLRPRATGRLRPRATGRLRPRATGRLRPRATGRSQCRAIRREVCPASSRADSRATSQADSRATHQGAPRASSKASSRAASKLECKAFRRRGSEASSKAACRATRREGARPSSRPPPGSPRERCLDSRFSQGWLARRTTRSRSPR